MEWYRLRVQQVIEKLQTHVTQGLSSQNVAERRAQYGYNELPEAYEEPFILVFLRQFYNPLIAILLIAATIIFFLGEHRDAFIISGVLLFNAAVGTIQEGRARTILKRLRHYVKARCVVIRDGERSLIDSIDLVPGDIIILAEGEKIPADAYILEAYGAEADESLLTGESTSVAKYAGIL